MEMKYSLAVTFFSVAFISTELSFSFFFFCRFFCNDADMLGFKAKDDGDTIEDVEEDCKQQEVKHVAEDETPFLETEKTKTVSSLPEERPRSCFQWLSILGNHSGNPGPSHTVFSQQSHQQRSNCMESQADDSNGVQAESGAVCGESDEESSPLIEPQCFSQSQKSVEPPQCSLRSSKILQVSNNNSDTKIRKRDISTFAYIPFFFFLR